MAQIVITERMHQASVDSLSAEFEVLYDATLGDRQRDVLATLGSGCRALIVRNRTRVDARLLAHFGDLEVVGRLGVGLDNIDLDACRKRRIAVQPALGANLVSVAEYVIAGVLMLLRGAYHDTARVLAGEWPRARLIGGEAFGKTLGIVGFGAIGQAVAERARALGMRVLAYDPRFAAHDPLWRQTGVEARALSILLADSDALTLHVPLNNETRDLIDAAALASMKPGAVLINTSRGGVVDETALAEALRAKRLGGALLDVYAHEPVAGGSHLIGVPNLFLTPHIAGITRESDVRVGEMIAAAVRRALTTR